MTTYSMTIIDGEIIACPGSGNWIKYSEHIDFVSVLEKNILSSLDREEQALDLLNRVLSKEHIPNKGIDWEIYEFLKIHSSLK